MSDKPTIQEKNEYILYPNVWHLAGMTRATCLVRMYVIYKCVYTRIYIRGHKRKRSMRNYKTMEIMLTSFVSFLPAVCVIMNGSG